ncbi:hypothetical protein BO71DRAFT_389663 [Aspergillus ellipticus CBS 707.79]|uniref:Kynurenine formamidase n=1 Tax=Aspergillus ellipticus CBS 707.79 TaxID=1448320 RepID=A0A319D4I2_9EURO|nr:hypothetical protein BO71DRAFT_389663 [Aspergillus ellipticus CBS 707.79]
MPTTETLPYGTDHALQTVTVTTLDNPNPEGYWVILIHGGAWRDPTQTSSSYLTPALTTLTTNPLYTTTTTPHIAALASISYRLSPHPAHPQDPVTTSPYDLRAAKHPDHLADIRAAISFLKDRYGFGGRYILVGHSCGATLAFQGVMRALGLQVQVQAQVKSPVGIVGMAGIYDLKLLRDCHAAVDAYQAFIVGAFGEDEGLWDSVSPARVRGGGGVVGGWKGGRLAVLANSPEDGLVDPKQREAMRGLLGEWVEGGEGRRVEVLDIVGDHDDAWEKGEGLARAIAFAVEKLRE